VVGDSGPGYHKIKPSEIKSEGFFNDEGRASFPYFNKGELFLINLTIEFTGARIASGRMIG
jgi:hypothetical protein